MQIIYRLSKGSEIEKFLRYDYLFLKVLHKLFRNTKKKPSDDICKLNFYDILKVINNPYAEDRLRNFILAIASYFPFTLRKIILRRIYNFRVKMYNNLFG
ncbi:Hypothetical protein SSO0826 [Saccharolobus solfataricus P2]|uniref:Uncharacterized protein n=2 Tax=Saccharolobus solfataricus TaxID=2287 RepID=Q7LXF2_SACS2|nr:hypothetical protein [Saccharolobus solfataricus]AAK41121.1 Hypothetical protein SSO0826 [Saccharolobus solfataricus P2]CAB57478.1 hypothetical protein [Saccharolobus solfataricus P2]SAI84422.1 uncharacterised protein [Saccharolobus solfataricus]